MVDKDERNDLSFLFILEVERGRIARIRLHPTCIEDLGVRLANEREASFLEKTMHVKCAAFGVKLEFENHVGMVTIG
jgi:poly-gamma-glutamate synthesis protein (capsule biosynthesis protein)